MPDNRDYDDLAELLARPEQWSDAEAQQVRILRRSQADATAAFEQRDQQRVAAMRSVVRKIDEAIDQWQQARS